MIARKDADDGLMTRAAHLLNEYPLCNFERNVVVDLIGEIGRLRTLLDLSPPERRHRFISDSLAIRGFINRADLCREFGVSVPQASRDLADWMHQHPGTIAYNKSAKRYEWNRHD